MEIYQFSLGLENKDTRDENMGQLLNKHCPLLYIRGAQREEDDKKDGMEQEAR